MDEISKKKCLLLKTTKKSESSSTLNSSQRAYINCIISGGNITPFKPEKTEKHSQKTILCSFKKKKTSKTVSEHDLKLNQVANLNSSKDVDETPLKKKTILNKQGNEQVINLYLAKNSELCTKYKTNRGSPLINKKNLKLKILGKNISSREVKNYSNEKNYSDETHLPDNSLDKQIILGRKVFENITSTALKHTATDNMNELTTKSSVVDLKKSESYLVDKSSHETGLHTEISHDTNYEKAVLRKEVIIENQLSDMKMSDTTCDYSFVDDLNKVHQICTEDLTPDKRNTTPVKYQIEIFSCSSISHEEFSSMKNYNTINQQSAVSDIPSPQNTEICSESETPKKQKTVETNNDVIKFCSIVDSSETPDIYIDSLQIESDNISRNANFTKISPLNKNKIPKHHRKIVNDSIYDEDGKGNYSQLLSIQSNIDNICLNKVNNSNLENKTVEIQNVSFTSNDDILKYASNSVLKETRDSNKADSDMKIKKIFHEDINTSSKSMYNPKKLRIMNKEESTEFNCNIDSIEVSSVCKSNSSTNDVTTFTKISPLKKKKEFHLSKKSIRSKIKNTDLAVSANTKNLNLKSSNSGLSNIKTSGADCIVESEKLSDLCNIPFSCEDEQFSKTTENGISCENASVSQNNQIAADNLDTFTKIKPMKKELVLKISKIKKSVLTNYSDSTKNKNHTTEQGDSTNSNMSSFVCEDDQTSTTDVNVAKLIYNKSKINLSLKNRKNVKKLSNINTKIDICKNINDVSENDSNEDVNMEGSIDNDTQIGPYLVTTQYSNNQNPNDTSNEIIDQNTCSSNMVLISGIILEKALNGNQSTSTLCHTEMNNKSPLSLKEISCENNTYENNNILDTQSAVACTPVIDTLVMTPHVDHLNSEKTDILASSSTKYKQFQDENPIEKFHEHLLESSTELKSNGHKSVSQEQIKNKNNTHVILSQKRKSKVMSNKMKNRNFSKPTLSSSCSDEENVEINNVLTLSDSSLDLELNQKPHHSKKGLNFLNSERIETSLNKTQGTSSSLESISDKFNEVIHADKLSNGSKLKKRHKHISNNKLNKRNIKRDKSISELSNKTHQPQEKQNNNETNMDELKINTKKKSNKEKTMTKSNKSKNNQGNIIKQKHIIESIQQLLPVKTNNMLDSEEEYQCASSQKSNKNQPLMWTSTPIVHQHSEERQGTKAKKYLFSSSIASTSTNLHKSQNQHTRTTCSVLQSPTNDTKEDIQSSLINSEDDLTGIKNLEINIDWDIPKLHTIGSESPNISLTKLKYKLKRCEDNSINLAPYSELEEEKIKRNWETFSSMYGFRNANLFVSSNKFKKYFSKTDRLKFQQFLARGLPDRRLHSVYAKFKDFVLSPTYGRWSSAEDKLLLKIHQLYNDPEEYGAARNIIMPKILGRSGASISNRLSSFLKNTLVQDLLKMTVEWTSELEGSLVHHLLEFSGVDTVEDLRSNSLPYETWTQVVDQLKLPFCQVVDHWRYNLYPRLYSRSSVTCPALYIDLIKWIHDAEIKDWEEIDWEELSNLMEGVGSYFLSKCLRMLILNYVPPARYHIFRACIRYLYLYCVPDMMAKKSEHVLKRVRYNPSTRLVEEIKDIDGSSDEEDKEDN